MTPEAKASADPKCCECENGVRIVLSGRLRKHIPCFCKCHKTSPSVDPKPESNWKKVGECKCGHPLMEKNCADGEALEALPHHVCPPSVEEVKALEMAVGIDMGKGSDKAVVSLAKKEEGGKICIVSCESISNELASYIQNLEAQNTKLLADWRVMKEALKDIESPFNNSCQDCLQNEALAYEARSSLQYYPSPTQS